MTAALATRTERNPPPPFGPVPTGFDVLRLAAAGVFGEVWEVCETRTGTPFAWKRLKAAHLGNSDAVERLRREAHVLERCEGAGVVALHRDLTDETPPSILLEWRDGSPLQDRLVRGKPLAPRTAFWIGRQIVQGMRSLAAAGHAHGDLRPANVVVDVRGEVRLLSLGCALPLDGRPAFRRPESAADAVDYLAPERQSRRPFDPLAADVYSLGVMLFEMLAGRLPFLGENVEDVQRLHRQAQPPQLNVDGMPNPEQGTALVSSLLRKEPLRRPGNLSELLRRLLDLELQTLIPGGGD
jgi:serine/threonine protein kinase